MSIAVLNQVYDEMRRLAIAGSNLAAGDFRLKKLVAPLQVSAAKAPVFGKVAEAIEKLIDSNSQNSAEALLELSTLVSAILYTQGETGIEGNLKPIETSDIGIPTSNASARVLKPLIEALTTTGSGREEIIRDAQKRNVFKDLRLVRIAVGAIDDPYGPIADFVCQEVLPIYGKAIYDDVRAGYNAKAKGGHVRRLRILHKLDRVATHELVEQALESGSPDMKVAAIECLEGREDMLSYLLEQSRAKSAEVRRAALGAMAKLGDDEVVEAISKSLAGKDLQVASDAASQNRSPKLLKYLLEEGKKQLGELFAIKDKKKLAQAIERFYHWLSCFHSRNDKESIAFLTGCFEQREAIEKLKGDLSINQRVGALLVESCDKAALKTVADAHATLPASLLEWSLLAAIRTRKPKEVYDLFSPYYRVAGEGKKKRSDPAMEKRETIQEVLEVFAEARPHRRYYHGGVYWGRGALDINEFAPDAQLDPRWLDAAIETDDLNLVHELARPKHKGTIQYLSQQLERMIEKRDLDFECDNVVATMLRIQHPQATDHFLAALKKAGTGKGSYFAYWLARLIPDLPKAAAPQIEAMLPTMNEKVVDQVAPYLAELQAKA